MVMFQCVVSELGRAHYSITYRGTPETQPLREEVLVKLNRAEFRPALVNGQKKTVLLNGTVMFAIIDGKPRIRVFLNQEEKDLLAGRDFIAPQVILDYGTKLKRIEWPTAAGGNNGTVAMDYTITADGSVQGMKPSYENPKGMGFASEVMRGTEHAPFIPAFRNVKPVSCTFTLPFIFRGGRGPSFGTG